MAQHPDDTRLTRRDLLFTLWVVVMFLYAYCDILGLYDSRNLNQLLTGEIDGIRLDATMLIAASVLMIAKIAAMALTRILPVSGARWVNIGVGTMATLVMVASLTTPNTVYYWIFAVIEIATSVAIVWLAWTWRVASPTRAT